MRRFVPHRFSALVLLIGALGTSTAGCSSGSSISSDRSRPTTIRLGYFPNLTHASAIVGVERGYFAHALGKNHLQTQLFNAGAEAVTALFSGALDAAYLGPNVTVNAFQKSHGRALRIVSGATSGGVRFIVSKHITRASDLKGTTISTPQLGATQDVAARTWLRAQGLSTDFSGGGDVSILPQDNSHILEAFKEGTIAGAWVPEPWATRLEMEAGGHQLVDERDLWPRHEFVTTQLVVSKDLLDRRPDLVQVLVDAQVRANAFLNNEPEAARRAVSAAITKYTGKTIPNEVMSAAWNHLRFTNDPLVTSLRASAHNAETLGLLDRTSLDDIYELNLLNAALRRDGLKAVHTK
ncbi:MAG: ABC transporter substrate-binding protein [Acidimicrobiia bacterium]